MLKQISLFIKERRKRAQLTQIQLAERAGVGLRFLRELEQGKETEREWNKEKKEFIESKKEQLSLFDNKTFFDITEFELVDKVPYRFKFIFEDDDGKMSKMMIEDWEIGMLFWNSLVKNNGNEDKARADVKKKYYDDFAKTKDYHFILGTTKLHHFTTRNPFVIIGGFRPKYIEQQSLF